MTGDASRNRSEDIAFRAIPSLLRLLATRSWRELTLAEIGQEAGIALADFSGRISREDLLREVDTFFDLAMSADGPCTEGDARERLFDVLMKRFEAMEPYRDGLAEYFRLRASYAGDIPGRARAMHRTAAWALASAGLDDDMAAPFVLKRIALVQLIAQAERAWRRDAAGDFSATMAVLDQGLSRMEDRLRQLQSLTGRFGMPRGGTDGLRTHMHGTEET